MQTEPQKIEGILLLSILKKSDQVIELLKFCTSQKYFDLRKKLTKI
jgi:hypothetical protein